MTERQKPGVASRANATLLEGHVMRIRDRYAPTLICVTIALGSSSASATTISVVLLTQERTISASATGCTTAEGCSSSSDSDAAIDFDAFDSAVSASAPDGSGFASQLSTITPSLISASAHTSALAQSSSFQSSGSGNAQSVFRVSFSATEPTGYTIQGSHLTLFHGSGLHSVAISLRDSGGNVLWATSGGTPDPPLIEFATSGTLAPGDYVLEASARSSASLFLMSDPSVWSADFNFEFSIVPEPSTATSLGLGLALLGLRGRRRERRRA